MAIVARGLTFGATETVTNTKLHNLVDDATVTAIQTADISDLQITTIKLAANSVDGTKIAIGSDAQGDVIYFDGTDYTRLAAGTSGQFLKTQGAGANPIWDTVAVGGLSANVGSFTRDLTLASGTQQVTGVGFQPVAIIFIAAVQDTVAMSVGIEDGTTNHALHDRSTTGAGTYGINTSAGVFMQTGNGISYEVTTTALESDGFTVTWLRTGAPTGTAQINYLAIA